MLWVKVFHVLFVISWLAGVFYLPRIMVHYAEGRANDEDVRRLITMASKLQRFSFIMAALAIGFGAWLWLGFGISGNWLHAKLGCVALLVGYQMYCGHLVTRMNQGDEIGTSLSLRLLNEAPLVLVVPILIFVIVKPF
jgi:putative membrane protein